VHGQRCHAHNWPEDDRWVYEDQCQHPRRDRQERNSSQTSKAHHDGDQRQNNLVGVRCTLGVLCHVDKTWNDQGNDCFGCASEISTVLRFGCD
jgi:hypothetical protein